MNIFIYARTAQKSQNKIEAQVQACKEFATKEGYEISEVFIDDGFSGISDDRPSYKKLLEAAKQGDTVIVSSAGSLYRDTSKLFALKNKFNLIFLDQEGR
jgi:DNA invertase Pin-like site-specific DNA recombinase